MLKIIESKSDIYLKSMNSLEHMVRDPETAALWFFLVWYPATSVSCSPEMRETSFYSGLNEKVDFSALRIGKAKVLEGSRVKGTPVNATGFSLWEKIPFDSCKKGENRFFENTTFCSYLC
jgi:hypothetical protein